MNYDLENTILGQLLLKPDLMKKIVISENHFLDITNKFVFKLLKKQYEDYRTIDIVGLIQNYSNEFNEKFPSNKIIEKLTELSSEIIINDNFDYYQELLFSRYIESEIMKSINNFHNKKITKEELLNDIHKFESYGIKLNENKLSGEELYKLISAKNKNINFRFKKLSNTANIQEHDLVVIAARTGIGKSGFCLNILEDISDKYNCIMFNMEIAEKQIYQRLVSINTGIAMKYLDHPETEFQKNKIQDGCKNISKKKIKIFNQAQTIASIRRKIINESKNEHTIVFIDHVGLIIPQKNTSLYENLTQTVKELRQISLDYNCTIFLVSQLNRNADDESIPKISELKDSGELEQSATTVIMLHDENHNKNLSKDQIEMTFVIGKNRNGSLGATKYLYNKTNQRFEEK